jgi:hypothetical protein
MSPSEKIQFSHLMNIEANVFAHFVMIMARVCKRNKVRCQSKSCKQLLQQRPGEQIREKKKQVAGMAVN